MFRFFIADGALVHQHIRGGNIHTYQVGLGWFVIAAILVVLACCGCSTECANGVCRR